MPPWTFRPHYAKPPIEVRALDAPLILARMEIQALPAQLAFPQLDVEDAHRHRPEIEVVGVFAVVAHLAQVPEVVLAHGRLLFALPLVSGEDGGSAEVVRGGRGVAVWAEGGG